MRVAVGAAPASTDADGPPLGTADLRSVSDAVVLIRGPPSLCPTPVPGSGPADKSADDEPGLFLDNVGEAALNDCESESDGELDADELDEIAEGLDGPLLLLDEEPDEPAEPEDEELDDELESDGSAKAVPGMVATADPTPSATASAPTRPT